MKFSAQINLTDLLLMDRRKFLNISIPFLFILVFIETLRTPIHFPGNTALYGIEFFLILSFFINLVQKNYLLAGKFIVNPLLVFEIIYFFQLPYTSPVNIANFAMLLAFIFILGIGLASSIRETIPTAIIALSAQFLYIITCGIRGIDSLNNPSFLNTAISSFVFLLLFIVGLLFLLLRIHNKEQKILQLNSLLSKKIRKEELALGQAHKALLEQAKLKTLKHSYSGVIHELNTPLGVGITATSYLKDEIRDLQDLNKRNKTLEKMEESIGILEANLSKAHMIINNFREMALTLQREEPKDFYLKKYIDMIVASLSSKLKRKSTEVHIDCPEDLHIRSYPGSLAQILTNLILNSINHGFISPGKNMINIEIEYFRHVKLDPDSNCKEQDADLIIRYYDNGKGIDDSLEKDLFKPYVTTDMEHGHYGLGMSLIKTIVEEVLKGSISYKKSSERTGVFFEIKLVTSCIR